MVQGALSFFLLVAVGWHGWAHSRLVAFEDFSPAEQIARSAVSSPLEVVPEGFFLMGTAHHGGKPYGFETQYDDTEQPRRRIWLNAFLIDRYEVSLGEYLRWLQAEQRPLPKELRDLINHMITVHAVQPAALAHWPALYVTWQEASAFCRAQGKRLPTEAEWEKAARGVHGQLFPWGSQAPSPILARFGQYHVHEIPLVEPVESRKEGRSPYGLHHMAGNAAEWVADWFGTDYYAIMPTTNPSGPSTGRYKSVRGGSWKSSPQMLRAATRGGALPEQRAATIGFRCAKSGGS
ncbi:MAG: formylglycine-generating enzyme family protein [Nitrospira sp.]|nr:formylglycine-generating enzyme family protein [Nitrospira sp.]MCP9442697.1 formylglycine-generating enzyme family protein [Nitrospira sp.]